MGTRGELEHLEEELNVKMLLKRRAMLGWGRGGDKRITILNRIVEMTGASYGTGADAAKAVSYKPDPRRAENALRELGLDGAGREGRGDAGR